MPGGNTVTDAVPCLLFDEVAVIVTGPPTATPLTTPEPLTVARFGSDVPHVNVVVTMLLFASRANAVSFLVPETKTFAGFGVTVTVAGGPSGPVKLHGLAAVDALRGAGVTTAKSADGLPVK